MRSCLLGITHLLHGWWQHCHHCWLVRAICSAVSPPFVGSQTAPQTPLANTNINQVMLGGKQGYEGFRKMAGVSEVLATIRVGWAG